MTVQTKQSYQTLSTSLPLSLNARWTYQLLLGSALILTDLVMISLGFWLAYLIRFALGVSWFYHHEVSPIYFYQHLVFRLVPLWIIVFWLFGLYEFKNLFSGTREYAHVFNASTLGMMIIIVGTFFYPDFVIARAWLILSWLLVIGSVELGRFGVRRVVQRLRFKGYFLRRVLVIGANEEGRAIAEQLHANPRAGIQIAGIMDNHLELGSELLPGIAVLGNWDVEGIRRMIEKEGIQEIIVAATALPREQLLKLFQAFGTDEQLTIHLSSGLYELLTTGVEVQEVGNVPLVSVNKVRLTGADIFLKSMLDWLVSLGLLLVLAPVMAAIAVLVKLDSPGPIIHRRRVIGVGGKPFDAYKFRTMYTDADERLARDPELKRQFEMNFKLKDDPRVTRIGQILRRTSLDELPQLFNVLRGQMGLVGPRMITKEEQARYGKWQWNLSTVKPGITGLWQVSGRSDVSYEERVMLDMHYIRNYTIWFDLYLLWQTIPAVLKKRGAY